MEGIYHPALILLGFLLVAIGVYVLARLVSTAYFRAKRDFLSGFVTQGKDKGNGEEDE